MIDEFAKDYLHADLQEACQLRSKSALLCPVE